MDDQIRISGADRCNLKATRFDLSFLHFLWRIIQLANSFRRIILLTLHKLQPFVKVKKGLGAVHIIMRISEAGFWPFLPHAQ